MPQRLRLKKIWMERSEENPTITTTATPAPTRTGYTPPYEGRGKKERKQDRVGERQRDGKGPKRNGSAPVAGIFEELAGGGEDNQPHFCIKQKGQLFRLLEQAPPPLREGHLPRDRVVYLSNLDLLPRDFFLLTRPTFFGS